MALNSLQDGGHATVRVARDGSAAHTILADDFCVADRCRLSQSIMHALNCPIPYYRFRNTS
jgi:hypothetical protein